MTVDDRCVELLLATSSREGLLRYHDEVARGVPAHDHDRRDPRAYAVPCANPRCHRRVLVTGWGPHRRYCDVSCRCRARYWTDPAWRASKLARERAQYRAERVA